MDLHKMDHTKHLVLWAVQDLLLVPPFEDSWVCRSLGLPAVGIDQPSQFWLITVHNSQAADIQSFRSC